MRPPHRTSVAAAAACAVLAISSAAAPARAYLIDLNDARVVPHGSMELELQPIGYWQTVIGDEDHQIIAPSSQLYWGFAPGWDILWLTRGFALLDDPAGQSPYSIAEQMLAFRAMLVDGAYSSEGEREGPSLTLQAGLLLPGIEAEAGFGATAGLLFAQQWDAGTLHLNVWANFTQARTFELFVSAVIEAPPAWSVRPCVEVWLDLDDGEPMISGLIGAVGDVSDEVAIQAGVRMGGWEGYLDLEARLSFWFAWEVWDPEATGPGDRARSDRGSSAAR